MTTHHLKITDRFFDAVDSGIKTFEVRKADRDYRIGDTLDLARHDPTGKTEGPARIRTEVTITYMLTHDDFPEGVPEGYVVLGIRRLDR